MSVFKNEEVSNVDEHPQDVLQAKDRLDDAVKGENREHEMTLWEGFKTHPKACFWAFVFCFTIVSVSLPRTLEKANV